MLLFLTAVGVAAIAAFITGDHLQNSSYWEKKIWGYTGPNYQELAWNLFIVLLLCNSLRVPEQIYVWLNPPIHLVGMMCFLTALYRKMKRQDIYSEKGLTQFGFYLGIVGATMQYGIYLREGNTLFTLFTMACVVLFTLILGFTTLGKPASASKPYPAN